MKQSKKRRKKKAKQIGITTISAREILKAQVEYFALIADSLEKIDWKNQEPNKMALEFPVYMTRVFRNLVILTEAMLSVKEKEDAKVKN